MARVIVDSRVMEILRIYIQQGIRMDYSFDPPSVDCECTGCPARLLNQQWSFRRLGFSERKLQMQLQHDADCRYLLARSLLNDYLRTERRKRSMVDVDIPIDVQDADW